MKNIQYTKMQQFLYTMIPFAILGAAFKVMTLVEGITEVRPANGIPVPAGLLFGPIGGLGCAVGNLIADLFGTFSGASVLGLIGNFFAAYLPYRLWYLSGGDAPNVHTYQNIARYLLVSYNGALTVAWFLGFGLELFFGMWMKTIYLSVFFNNFGFSVVLGLPFLIVLTSEGVNLMPCQGRVGLAGKHKKAGTALIAAYTVIMTALCVLAGFGLHLENNIFAKGLSIIGAVILAAMIL